MSTYSQEGVNMKKILPLILAIILIFSMASCSSKQESTETSTDRGVTPGKDNTYSSETGTYEYQLNEEGKCEIVSYTPASVAIVDVVLPTTLDNRDVVGVAAEAFKAENSIKSIKIPDTYTYISDYAFYDCDSLLSVTVEGTNLADIGMGAFEGCSVLTTVSIPSSVETISNFAFKDCEALTSIDVSGATVIGEGAFFGCYALSSIVLSDNISSISKTAFYHCDNLNYATDDGALYLGSASNEYLVLISVEDLNIESCKVNANAKVIADQAFANCPLLSSVILSDSITTLSAASFENSDILEYNEFENGLYLGSEENPYMVLMSLAVPSVEDFTLNTATKILCDAAFDNCVSLADIHFAGTKAEWEAIIKVPTWNYGRTVRVLFADETEEPIIYN